MSQSSEGKEQLPHHYKAAVQFSSGAIAGFIEVCVNHPLDVVKTRLQMQSADDPNRYKSIVDCLRRMTKSEGVLSIYKGIVPVLVVETPKMALRFLVYEQTKRVISPYMSLVPSNLIAGFMAGAIEGIAVNPFEVVKVGTGLFSGCVSTLFNIPWDVVKSRIQGLQPVPGEVKYKTCWQSFKVVYREEGFLALYKGLAPKMLRLGTGHALIIVLYEHIVEVLEAMASKL